jgi:hypothetical protein
VFLLKSGCVVTTVTVTLSDFYSWVIKDNAISGWFLLEHLILKPRHYAEMKSRPGGKALCSCLAVSSTKVTDDSSINQKTCE